MSDLNADFFPLKLFACLSNKLEHLDKVILGAWGEMVSVDPNGRDVLPIWQCLYDRGEHLPHELVNNIEPIEDEFEDRQFNALRHAGLNVRK